MLPAMVDRNFSFAADMSHGVWIESKQALAASAPGLTASRVDDRLFRITGAIGDRDLARTRQAITVERNPAHRQPRRALRRRRARSCRTSHAALRMRTPR